MTFNPKMHPRNPFKNNPPDFAQLSIKYPEFSAHCKFEEKKCSIDFKNPDSLRSLFYILMKELFGNFKWKIMININ